MPNLAKKLICNLELQKFSKAVKLYSADTSHEYSGFCFRFELRFMDPGGSRNDLSKIKNPFPPSDLILQYFCALDLVL